MRHIGSIPEENDAVRFGDYLLAQGMKNHVEEGASGWAVWVEHDDQLDAAKAELDAFRANARDPKYDGAVRKAEQIRKDEEKRQERLRSHYRDVRTSWGSTQKFIQPVTIALLAFSLLAAAATRLGNDVFSPAMNALRIQSIQLLDPNTGETNDPPALYDVRHGQVWRLITPIFVHYGALHLVFNMLWLVDLGGQVERARGSIYLLAFAVVAAVISNLAEYAWSGPFFGGMSGVVYALFGYIWIKGRYEPHLGMGVTQQTVIIMLAWLVLCMIGLVGDVANAAHLVGLIIGVAAAYAPIELRKLRRRLRS
jgi:GlpG protein